MLLLHKYLSSKSVLTDCFILTIHSTSAWISITKLIWMHLLLRIICLSWILNEFYLFYSFENRFRFWNQHLICKPHPNHCSVDGVIVYVVSFEMLPVVSCFQCYVDFPVYLKQKNTFLLFSVYFNLASRPQWKHLF